METNVNKLFLTTEKSFHANFLIFRFYFLNIKSVQWFNEKEKENILIINSKYSNNDMPWNCMIISSIENNGFPSMSMDLWLSCDIFHHTLDLLRLFFLYYYYYYSVLIFDAQYINVEIKFDSINRQMTKTLKFCCL